MTIKPWYKQTPAQLSSTAKASAEARQNELTKPSGSLGRVEEIAIQLCSMQNTERPKLDGVAIRVFAADHGVAAEGVSAFPQAVTVEMIKNFLRGGAAISVLAKALDADFSVVNVGTAIPFEADGLIDCAIARGTHNFCDAPAMSLAEFERAMESGRSVAVDAIGESCHCFVGGEMGIGNTTAAAALACALLDQEAELMVGRGTGVDHAGRLKKVDCVNKALLRHCSGSLDLETIASRLGGFEIIALTGAYIQCALDGVPVLVDGFICSVAALLACRLNPEVRPWLMFSHKSEEQGHLLVLAAMNAKPLLDLNLRLGEASGAALALPLLRLACELHSNMATFAEAAVSESEI